jgi:hypothetical protein
MSERGRDIVLLKERREEKSRRHDGEDKKERAALPGAANTKLSNK